MEQAIEPAPFYSMTSISMLCGESSPNRNYRRTLKRYAKREIIYRLQLLKYSVPIEQLGPTKHQYLHTHYECLVHQKFSSILSFKFV